MSHSNSLNVTLRKSLLRVAVSLAILASGCVSQQKSTPTDLAQLQGEWRMTSGSADGFLIPAMMLPSFKRICKSNEVTVTNGDQLIMKATITIDQTRNPKTIDYDVTDGPTKGKRHLGIYELDGDVLTSCFGDPDSQRPADFTTRAGDRRTSSVWERTNKE